MNSLLLVNPNYPASKDTIAQWIEHVMCIGGADTDVSNHILVVQFSLAKHTLLVFQLTIYSNADSEVPIVHFTNFIVGHLSGMITQEVLNFLIAFGLQLIVHKTFCLLHFKAGWKGLYIQWYCLC